MMIISPVDVPNNKLTPPVLTHIMDKIRVLSTELTRLFLEVY